MNASTNTTPSLDIIRTAAARLAPLLIRRDLRVTVGRLGVVEVCNPLESRMRQPIVLREHQGGLWWWWLWSGPTRDAPPELEPMVHADDVEEAARRIANVLSVFGA